MSAFLVLELQVYTTTLGIFHMGSETQIWVLMLVRKALCQLSPSYSRLYFLVLLHKQLNSNTQLLYVHIQIIDHEQCKLSFLSFSVHLLPCAASILEPL